MKTQRSGKPLCRFPYTHQGKTLYYDIISDSTVEVTYYSSVVTNNYVNGDVLIPSSVEYNGTTYSVTSIGLGAFRGCSGLASVTIGSGVTSIDMRAFLGCPALTSVRCLAVTPPSIDNTSFYNVLSTCTLTVPCGSIGAYAGSAWNEYFAGHISEE